MGGSQYRMLAQPTVWSPPQCTDHKTYSPPGHVAILTKNLCILAGEESQASFATTNLVG
jgi:hypothetical protein